ncbi:unnamed protein product [Alopecurus aequalis]
MDLAVRKDLYPHVEPYETSRLEVSDVHTIYYEQSGNPGGHPVVFLHGGPGAGTSPGNRRFFDPEFYRIVLFDQRGAGKSTPHACLEENTTWDLVADIEKLREHLDIPECLAVHGEAPWPLRTARLTPIRLAIHHAFSWLGKRSSIGLTRAVQQLFSQTTIARIENHYFVNKGFLPSDSHLLDNVEKIRHIKAFIVQGRYDACCPMMSAWDLHKAWPEAEFKVVPDAGHSAIEVGITAELVSANEQLKSMLRK